jgi:hypothetical protein
MLLSCPHIVQPSSTSINTTIQKYEPKQISDAWLMLLLDYCFLPTQDGKWTSPSRSKKKSLLYDLSHQFDDRVPSLFLFKYPKYYLVMLDPTSHFPFALNLLTSHPFKSIHWGNLDDGLSLGTMCGVHVSSQTGWWCPVCFGAHCKSFRPGFR